MGVSCTLMANKSILTMVVGITISHAHTKRTVFVGLRICTRQLRKNAVVESRLTFTFTSWDMLKSIALMTNQTVLAMRILVTISLTETDGRVIVVSLLLNARKRWEDTVVIVILARTTASRYRVEHITLVAYKSIFAVEILVTVSFAKSQSSLFVSLHTKVGQFRKSAVAETKFSCSSTPWYSIKCLTLVADEPVSTMVIKITISLAHSHRSIQVSLLRFTLQFRNDTVVIVILALSRASRYRVVLIALETFQADVTVSVLVAISLAYSKPSINVSLGSVAQNLRKRGETGFIARLALLGSSC